MSGFIATQIDKETAERWYKRGQYVSDVELAEKARVWRKARRKSVTGRICEFCKEGDNQRPFHMIRRCERCDRAYHRYGVCGLCERPHAPSKECPVSSVPPIGLDRPSVEWQTERVQREIYELPDDELFDHLKWLNAKRCNRCLAYGHYAKTCKSDKRNGSEGSRSSPQTDLSV